MDFILGDALPRRNSGCVVAERKMRALVYEEHVIEESEERMLPDSSLSPSNQHHLASAMLMDLDSKLSDAEFVGRSIGKRMMADGRLGGDLQYRLVVDGRGEKYMVAEADLVPLVEHPDGYEGEGGLSPSKECTTTVDSETETVLEASVEAAGGGSILESFLYASQLALVEVKLSDIETELWHLDRCSSVAEFVNCAGNLRGAVWPASVDEGVVVAPRASSSVAGDDRDADRRRRLGQIGRRHAELRRWLAKIKRRLRERERGLTGRLGDIVDFSGTEMRQLPLPTYLEPPKAASPSCDQKGPHKEKQEEDAPSSSSSSSSSSASSSSHSGSGSDAGDKPVCEPSKEGSDPDSSSIPHLCTYEGEPRKSGQDGDEDEDEEDQLVSTGGDSVAASRNPPTPDLRRAELDCNDISDGIRVLVVVQRDFLRAGSIHPSSVTSAGLPGGGGDGEDQQRLWRVALDGDRKCQEVVLSEWQLLEQGVREVVPTSASQLAPGSRVCASWSEQLPLNLYPGTVAPGASGASRPPHKLPIEFDDGDRKEVPLSRVRLLPENFPNLQELPAAASVHLVGPGLYGQHRVGRPPKKRPPGCRGRRPTTVVAGGGTESVKTRKRPPGGRAARDASGEAVPSPGKKGAASGTGRKKVAVHWQLTATDWAGRELVRNVDGLRVRAGDSVQLLSYSRHSYLACVVGVLARRQSDVMEIEFRWYYIVADVHDGSEAVRRLKRSPLARKALFETSHCDVNDVYSVVREVEVLPFGEYRLRHLGRGAVAARDDCYLLAGKYDHRTARVQEMDGGLRRYLA